MPPLRAWCHHALYPPFRARPGRPRFCPSALPPHTFTLVPCAAPPCTHPSIPAPPHTPPFVLTTSRCACRRPLRPRLVHLPQSVHGPAAPLPVCFMRGPTANHPSIFGRGLAGHSPAPVLYLPYSSVRAPPRAPFPLVGVPPRHALLCPFLPCSAPVLTSCVRTHRSLSHPFRLGPVFLLGYVYTRVSHPAWSTLALVRASSLVSCAALPRTPSLVLCPASQRKSPPVSAPPRTSPLVLCAAPSRNVPPEHVCGINVPLPARSVRAPRSCTRFLPSVDQS